MNVMIDRAEFILGGASRDLANAAHLIANRDALTADDFTSLKGAIAKVRGILDEVEVEVIATRTALTLPGATWDDRNEISAARAAAKGAA